MLFPTRQARPLIARLARLLHRLPPPPPLSSGTSRPGPLPSCTAGRGLGEVLRDAERGLWRRRPAREATRLFPNGTRSAGLVRSSSPGEPPSLCSVSRACHRSAGGTPAGGQTRSGRRPEPRGGAGAASLRGGAARRAGPKPGLTFTTSYSGRAVGGSPWHRVASYGTPDVPGGAASPGELQEARPAAAAGLAAGPRAPLAAGRRQGGEPRGGDLKGIASRTYRASK